MDDTLKSLSGTVRDSEYRDLFPETSVEKARDDPDKIKEALFQVHQMIYNPEIKQKAMDSDDLMLDMESILDMCDSRRQMERLDSVLKPYKKIGKDGKVVVRRENLLKSMRAQRRMVY